MTLEEPPASVAWDDCALVASLFAVDPIGTGGVAIRSLAGPVRDRWLGLLRELLPEAAPWRRVPLHISDARLLGGLDLSATLRERRPIAERGVLALANGGVVLLAMAERLTATTTARITATLDTGEVVVERDGFASRSPARIGVVALDESLEEDERLPAALTDRLGFLIDLGQLRVKDAGGGWHSTEEIAAARARLPTVRASEEIATALCGVAQALGIDSIRIPIFALRVARAAAALDGRSEVTHDDATLAGRLVLAPRATIIPAPPPEAEDNDESSSADGQQPDPPPPQDTQVESTPEDHDHSENPSPSDRPLEDVVLEAVRASIPAGLLAHLKMSGASATRARSQGKVGMLRHSGLRGRPAGSRSGNPRAGERLNVVETLRAAAPWQRLRGGLPGGTMAPGAKGPRIFVQPSDFRVAHYKQRSETTTIFVVDASGSSALHRLAEAKGAVELLLADCYVRRDRVAVLAFRGRGVELLLPPTRSLVRAKRSLAGLPGGGGTPLASAIDAAADLADAVTRRGGTPVVVLLTDGAANIARDGTPGRTRASTDATAAARRLRFAGITSLILDTSPRGQMPIRQLAVEMGARYAALSHADANTMSLAMRSPRATAAPIKAVSTA